MKIMVMGLFLTIPFAAFAQEIEKRDIALHIGIPIMYERFTHNEFEYLKTKASSFSFGIGLQEYGILPIKNIGLVCNFNVLMPEAIVSGPNNLELKYKKSDISAFDIQLGVIFNHLRYKNFKLPYTIGLHATYFSGLSTQNDLVTYDTKNYSFGIAASISTELHTKYVYFFIRPFVYLDLLSIDEYVKYRGISVMSRMAYYIDGDKSVGIALNAGIIPQIGIGMKIDQFFK